jgi:tetratricopeptide (TPR) repeat protein
MFQFEHIEYLWALIALAPMAWFYYYAVKKKKETITKIGDERLVKELIKDYSPGKYFLKFILIIIAFVFATFALANLRKPNGSITITRKGIDVMIALDVSKSMLAQDVKPNRLERAKQFISKLIDKLGDDKIGLVVFAGKAYLQMPLTIDHPAAKMYLSSITTDVVPTQGTVIGDALKMCYSSFNTQEKKYKSIILISDGEDHDESAIKITKALANEGVMVNTIGIGSPDGATIPDPETGELKKDADGSIVITKLNEEELKNIALNGNGIYQLFQNNNTDEIITALEAQLKQIGQKTITDNTSTNYEDYFPWFLAAALLVLIAEFFTSEIKNINVGNKKPVTKTALLTIFIFLSVTSFGQNENALIEQGNTAYKNQKFDEATSTYKKALEKNTANGTAEYNLGNALYKSGKSDDAINAYNKAIENSTAPINKENAWYNKGLSLQNNNKIAECIDAYKQALRLNPDDEDARQNLQKALEKQKQQQQQQNQNNNKEKKQKEQPKKKDNENEAPQQQASKLSKQDAEEKLDALMQQEKNLQDKLRRVNAATPDKPEKDW